MRLLSTKILTLQQRGILQQAAVEWMEYAAIEIKEKAFDLPPKMENVIFTSQHTVEIFLKKIKKEEVDIQQLQAYCVGEKTAALLKANEIEVAHTTSYAADLAQWLITKKPTDNFTFFCGNLRRDTLPEAFEKHHIPYREIQLYDTKLTHQVINKHFDMVLFYSPSGVRSYFENPKNPTNIKAICIGTTTANQAFNYIQDVAIAENTSVESVLEQALHCIAQQSIL